MSPIWVRLERLSAVMERLTLGGLLKKLFLVVGLLAACYVVVPVLFGLGGTALVMIPAGDGGLSDVAAIAAAEEFCRRLEVAPVGRPWVRQNGTNLMDLLLDKRHERDVVYSEGRGDGISLAVECRSREVIWYSNRDVQRRVMKKFGISPNNMKPRNWPPFLPEQQAGTIINQLAGKIGLPGDMVFDRVNLDSKEGIWRGHWTRRTAGYPYEDSHVSIEIMAVDGEFIGYRTNYGGTPCPTVVKISREVALETAWQRAAALFDRELWDRNRHLYRVTSAELMIVHPNTLFSRLIPLWHSDDYRLAWVVHITLDGGEDELARMGHHHAMTYKIDAATGRVIGGQDGRCR